MAFRYPGKASSSRELAFPLDASGRLVACGDCLRPPQAISISTGSSFGDGGPVGFSGFDLRRRVSPDDGARLARRRAGPDMACRPGRAVKSTWC